MQMNSFSKLRYALLPITLALVPQLMPAASAPQATLELPALIQAFKTDPRGPYKRIAWFCPDGTVRGAKEPCPEPGGIQHALSKDVIAQIRLEFGVYLGQILAGTPFDEFLDGGGYSRLKQFQMEKYLRGADDGWIMRHARHYRGAVQAEDEAAWGARFLPWLFSQDWFLNTQFYLGREIVRDIPHGKVNGKASRIRALSKRIADTYPVFMDIRVKIHGQPDATDRQRVGDFLRRHRQKISPDLREQLEALERDLETVYRSATVSSLEKNLGRLPDDGPVAAGLRALVAGERRGWQRRIAAAKDTLTEPVAPDTNTTRARADTVAARQRPATAVALKCRAMAELLWTIRTNIISTTGVEARLAMMDLSVDLEGVLFRSISDWHPETIAELVDMNSVLAQAAVGCGLLEVWEWHKLQPYLDAADSAETLGGFSRKVEASRRAVEWGVATTRAAYQDVVSLYADFELLALGFVDDRVRASILLPFGNASDRLSRAGAHLAGVTNRVLDLGEGVQIRGLNPGFAVGQLVVVTGQSREVSFAADRIYALLHPPADLDPVAGIVSVSEGNAVSHVQLLARNLGIPNAAITPKTFESLRAYSGQQVFYAVSPRGKVIMKRAADMTTAEKALIETRTRSERKVNVTTDKIDLTRAGVVNLDSLRATDSGRVCGPKAANLGQLKFLFPHRVAPGLVIPFGVFRRHMDRPMPGSGGSYWAYLQQTFRRAQGHRDSTRSEAAVENYVLSRLSILREAIRKMPVLPADRDAFRRGFAAVFGGDVGEVPVFIRSDTNMEDLSDFTGAGLNLTRANVLRERDIMQAVRDVWASPFTERSYRWRQRYLTHPENVYPSILMLRSIDVDKSGVMITTGLESGNPEDVTVAFNRGVGGAVAGQQAEMYLLREDGEDVLLAPARSAWFTQLSATGGTVKEFTSFDQPVLPATERKALREFAIEIKQTLAGVLGKDFTGPYDIELGFSGGKLWLFQVRPLVENQSARSSEYLRAMDTDLPLDVLVSPDEVLHGAN